MKLEVFMKHKKSPRMLERIGKSQKRIKILENLIQVLNPEAMRSKSKLDSSIPNSLQSSLALAVVVAAKDESAAQRKRVTFCEYQLEWGCSQARLLVAQSWNESDKSSCDDQLIGFMSYFKVRPLAAWNSMIMKWFTRQTGWWKWNLGKIDPWVTDKIDLGSSFLARSKTRVFNLAWLGADQWSWQEGWSLILCDQMKQYWYLDPRWWSWVAKIPPRWSQNALWAIYS